MKIEGIVRKAMLFYPNDLTEGKVETTCRTKLRTPGIKGARSAKERSKTFPGIAKAMAEQWG